MDSTAVQILTPQEYLEIERAATTKSEYLDGKVFAMSGASREHNLITVNITRELSLRLQESPCETYGSDMRVKVSATGLYTYPDAVVVCDEPRFEDDELDTLLNPTVIFEVLSSSTEAYDRGDKFSYYRKLESLRDYVLIAQDKRHIDHYVREPGGKWALREASNPDDVLDIGSINCVLRLSDVYLKVKFPA